MTVTEQIVKTMQNQNWWIVAASATAGATTAVLTGISTKPVPKPFAKPGASRQ